MRGGIRRALIPYERWTRVEDAAGDTSETRRGQRPIRRPVVECSTVERTAAVDLLRAALPYLGSPAHLEREPIVPLLLPGDPRPRGDRARRALLDLIEELRPLTPASWLDAGWRRYRHLVARYVEGQTRDQIATAQGVSTRQASRDHEHALEELADLLLARSRADAVADAVAR